jgi:hypothetical protein
MNPRPIAVKAMDNYRLLITFQNEECKIFDATPLLALPMYQKLRNKGFFALAKADGMCVYWNDEVDIDPDTLFEEALPLV